MTRCMGHKSPAMCNRCKKLPKDAADELARKWVVVRRDPKSDICVYFDDKDKP